jgi:hypothetical protein
MSDIFIGVAILAFLAIVAIACWLLDRHDGRIAGQQRNARRTKPGGP